MNDANPKKDRRTNTNFSVRLSREELRAINEMAEQRGINRNSLIRLSVRELAGMEFLDTRELMKATEKMETGICQLTTCLKMASDLSERIPKTTSDQEAYIFERLQILIGQMETTQDDIIDSQKKIGYIIMDFTEFVAKFLNGPINR